MPDQNASSWGTCTPQWAQDTIACAPAVDAAGAEDGGEEGAADGAAEGAAGPRDDRVGPRERVSSIHTPRATTKITNTIFIKFQAALRPSNTSSTNREPT